MHHEESATEVPSTEEEWLAQLDEPEDFGDEDGTDDDAATPEGSEPEDLEGEGDDQDPPEGDPEAQLEGQDDDADAAAVEGEPEEDPAGGQEPELDPEALTEADPSVEPDPNDASDALEWEPWVGKADGHEIRIDGAQVSNAGLFIPKEALPQLQSHLANRGEVYRQLNRMQAQLKERTGAEEQANHIVQYLSGLMQDPDAFWEWASNLDTNGPALIAEARAAGAEARVSVFEEEQRQRQVQEAEQNFRETFDKRILDAVTTALQWDEFAGLQMDPSEVADALKQGYGMELWAVAGKGGHKLSEDHVVPEGHRHLDTATFLAAMRAQAHLARQRAQIAAQTEAAKRRNRGRTDGRKKAPPAPRSTGAAPPPPDEPASPTSLDDWEKQLFDG